MGQTSPPEFGSGTSTLNTVRVVIRTVLGTGMGLLLLLWPAGRWDWIAGWSLVALFVVGVCAGFLVLRRHDPELLARRQSTGAGTKGWDLVLLSLYGLAVLAILVVGGLDAVRFQWTAMPPWLWLFGAVGFLGGIAIGVRAMLENTFFEFTVRIQEERGHRVIDTGPYRIVRHPGYVGACLTFLAIPLVLGSWWAFVPAVVTAGLLVLRTGLEDRTLHRELPGYPDYARRVRYRLVPGLW
jgi:protein-S-isoprenylcysteine O-methyltransferase Ste14